MLRLPTVWPICSSRVRVCRSVFAALAHLGLDLLLALGDPLGERLDLRLALVEGRLRGLRVDLARLLVERASRSATACEAASWIAGPWIAARGLRLGAPRGEGVDERDGERDDGYGEDDDRQPMRCIEPDGRADGHSRPALIPL